MHGFAKLEVHRIGACLLVGALSTWDEWMFLYDSPGKVVLLLLRDFPRVSPWPSLEEV